MMCTCALISAGFQQCLGDQHGQGWTRVIVGSKYEIWDLAKRAIEVRSIVCPRQQDLSLSQENNTKDSGKDKRTCL